MAGPYTEVTKAFEDARIYADKATTAMSSFLTALNSSIYSPPTISLRWQSIAPPTLPSMPTPPTMPEILFTLSLIHI